MFALVDANSFYASAEQVFRPEWRGRPIVVLSNNDGCIVAANRAALALGTKKFKAFFQQRAELERHGVIVCSSNYELYFDLSAKMMQVIGRFAPEQHIYSIDESFLSFERTPCISDLHQHGLAIRQAVWKECRLPVCVGFGPTLTLAKVANHAAKKLPGYHGVCVLNSERERIAVLNQLAAGDVWGIGRKLTRHLAGMGIHTAWQLSQLNPALASKRFSVELERTVRELNGICCKHWDAVHAGKKQIFSTRSVGQRITQLQELQQALCKHAGIVAAKLRAQQSCAVEMIAFAHNSPFDPRPVSFRQHQRLETPTDDTLVLSGWVTNAAKQLFRHGVQYYKIGVGALELVSSQHLQHDLLSPPQRSPALMHALDGINQRYGRGSLFVAGQGIEQKWAMRRERLTPQYTTRWSDIPKICCR